VGDGWTEFLFCREGTKKPHMYAASDPPSVVGGFLFLRLAVRVFVAWWGDGAGDDDTTAFRASPSWKSIPAYRALLEAKDGVLAAAVLAAGGAHLDTRRIFRCAKNPDFSRKSFNRDASWPT
jgi:hypothetical protein